MIPRGAFVPANLQPRPPSDSPLFALPLSRRHSLRSLSLRWPLLLKSSPSLPVGRPRLVCPCRRARRSCFRRGPQRPVSRSVPPSPHQPGICTLGAVYRDGSDRWMAGSASAFMDGEGGSSSGKTGHGARVLVSLAPVLRQPTIQSTTGPPGMPTSVESDDQTPIHPAHASSSPSELVSVCKS